MLPQQEIILMVTVTGVQWAAPIEVIEAFPLKP